MRLTGWVGFCRKSRLRCLKRVSSARAFVRPLRLHEERRFSSPFSREGLRNVYYGRLRNGARARAPSPLERRDEIDKELERLVPMLNHARFCRRYFSLITRVSGHVFGCGQ
jgi:hypothetical protein